MAAYNLAPIANFVSIFGSNTSASSPNNPLSLGTISTFAAGTSTPLQTYQTSTGTGWGTVITLDSTGRVPGEIWFPAGVAYKFVLKDSAGNLIPNGTLDNLVGINDTSSISLPAEWIASGFTATYSSSTSFTTTGNSTTTFSVGRRIQETDSVSTNYGVVTASVYTSGPNTTTVTCQMDPGNSLHSGITAMNVAYIDALGVSNYLSNTFTAANISTPGTITVTGTSLSTFAGDISAALFYGPLSGNATGLSGSSTVIPLGVNWEVDANNQITNNGNSMYMAAYYNSNGVTSGSTIPMNTQTAQQGTNFSLSSGAVASAAGGVYEVEAYGNFSDPGASNVTITAWFNASAGTVYGPNSSTTGTQIGMEGASGMVFSSWSIKCYWVATAAATIIPTTNITFAYIDGYTCVAGAQLKIRKIA